MNVAMSLKRRAAIGGAGGCECAGTRRAAPSEAPSPRGCRGSRGSGARGGRRRRARRAPRAPDRRRRRRDRAGPPLRSASQASGRRPPGAPNRPAPAAVSTSSWMSLHVRARGRGPRRGGWGRCAAPTPISQLEQLDRPLLDSKRLFSAGRVRAAALMKTFGAELVGNQKTLPRTRLLQQLEPKRSGAHAPVDHTPRVAPLRAGGAGVGR